MGTRIAPPHVGSANADWSRRLKGRDQSCEGPRDPLRVGTGHDEMLPPVLCSLFPLLPVIFGGPPQHPQPHLGAPQWQEQEHDAQGLFWDHAAIWGAQEAQEQRELPPEEAKRRLGLLVGLMDSDGSGGVSREELRSWILRRHRGSRGAELSAERRRLDRDGDGDVAWHEYREIAFGPDDDFQGSPDPDSHRQLLQRSRRRFQAADEDGDGRLREPELDAFLHPEDFPRLQQLVVQIFLGCWSPSSTPSCTPRISPGSSSSWCRLFWGAGARARRLPAPRGFPPAPAARGADFFGVLEPELDAFLHPEDFPRLQQLVVQETMEDLDRDGDGFIQVDEYIADLYQGSPGSPEPPEVQREREEFLRHRDRDGDGRLGAAEIQLWLRPPGPDWAALEAAHLAHHADLDKDGNLSREEILGRWELFVGSRATDYGQDLHREHDEL